MSAQKLVGGDRVFVCAIAGRRARKIEYTKSTNSDKHSTERENLFIRFYRSYHKKKQWPKKRNIIHIIGISIMIIFRNGNGKEELNFLGIIKAENLFQYLKMKVNFLSVVIT